jgi:hypothetical protein
VRRNALIAVLGLASLGLILGGCGGGGDALYTRAKTRSCLEQAATIKIDNKLDFVASTATGGALHVVLPQNAVTLVFGATIDDANNINDAYHRFRAKNVGVEDIIRQERNAVMLFRQHPTDDDLLPVEHCLS